MTSCLVRSVMPATLALLAATIVDAGETRLQAQGRLDAAYNVTLGGLPFGTGNWRVEVAQDHYTATASGRTGGLLKLFTSGRGTTASQGKVAGGQPIPASFASSIATDKKYDEVRMLFAGSNVKEYVAEPPNLPNPERVPITEAHRRNVVDPMTASMMKVPGSGSTFVPEACPRSVPIFDGRMRYDLQMQFKRLERVHSEKGYQGNVVVCAVHFTPIAGHVPSRPAIKYLFELRDTELWLGPIAGTRLMVPYRASLPTPFGMAVLQATEFTSTVASSAPPAAANARAQ